MVDSALELRDLTQALREVLAAVPAKALTEFAAKEQLLTGGFRPGKTAVLQERLLMTYGPTLLDPPEPFAAFLREQMPLARLFALLTQQVIEQHARTFFVFFSKPCVLLALLADSREALRTYAQTHLPALSAPLPEPAAAEETVKRLFGPVLGLGGAVSARRQNREEELHRTLEEERKRARADRREREETHARELRTLKAERDTARWSVEEQKRRVETLEQKLKQEEANREKRVRDLLAARQITLFQGWLQPLIALEESLADTSVPDLLSRAEAALAAQAQLDRAAQLAAAQESRLSAIEGMIVRAEDMLRVAQTKHPDLVAVHQALCAERDALARALRPDRQNAFTREVARRLLTATEADYEPALALLKLGRDLGLIVPADARALLADFHRLAARWAAGVPEAAKDLLEGSSAIERRNPRLRDALCGTRPAMLFFDGHNILNGLGRYKQRRGTAVTHEEGRERVGRDLVRLLQNLPMVCAHLVWDGAQKSDVTLSANVTAHFSGGTGEHRADRYILAQLAYYRQVDPALPLILITDDRDFESEAVRLGAVTCRLHDFEAFLNAPAR